MPLHGTPQLELQLPREVVAEQGIVAAVQRIVEQGFVLVWGIAVAVGS